MSFGGFSFGAAATPAPSNPFDGAPAATTTAAPSAFSFGAPAATTASTPAFGAPAQPATTTNMFGAPAQPAASTNMFGAPAQQPATATNIFGSAPAAAPAAAPATGGGLWGTAATTTTAAKPATTFGGFGTGTLWNTAATPAAAPQAALPDKPDAYFGGDKVDELQRKYAPVLDKQTSQPLPAALAGREAVPNDASCKFDWIFYSPKQTPPRQHQSYNNPRWERAEIDNPDPEKLEPVRELGIAGLKARFDGQGKACADCRGQATELRGVLETIEKTTRRTELKVEALKAKQAQLYNRMLSVVRSVEVLRCRGDPLRVTERRYRERLEHLAASLQPPHAKLQELMVHQSQHSRPNDVYSEAIADEDVETMCRLLRQQRDGLQHLTDILTKDARDVALVKKQLAPPNAPH